ncbi:MAG: hypothetical protein H6955_07830 [Chromatiaceae bacterium]|nr:hypothetical protein [Chromatiaceae bacterium]
MKTLSVLLVLVSLHFVMPAYADWDEAAEKREQAARERAAAAEKAQQRRAYADGIRGEMKRDGIDTRGKSDEQVIREFEAANKRRADAANQARAKGMDDMRRALGKEADGKSDDEVMALYSAKSQRDAAAVMRQTEANRPQIEAGVKEMTGKSMEQLMNMSDEELEKLGTQMERKYGR